MIKYTAGILLDSFVFCSFSHFSTRRLWVTEKFKVVFSLFRARTRTPWNSSWPAGIFANPSGKSVWNIMRFLDFLKNPNQSQSLFFLVEGHHFGSGKESASDLSSRHADISPQDFSLYCCLSQLLCHSARRQGQRQLPRAGGGFARTSQQAPRQTLAVSCLNARREAVYLATVNS